MLGRNKYLLFNNSDVAECNEICNNFINVVDALRIPMTTSSKIEYNNECFSFFYNTAYRKGFVKVSKSVNKTWEMTKHELSSLLFSALASIVESEKKNFITDPFIEKLWDEMEYTPFSKFRLDENGEMVLNESWSGWAEGTPRTVIDNWFDTHHSKGLKYLQELDKIVDFSQYSPITHEQFMALKAGDFVYLKAGFSMAETKALTAPYYNPDCDEPGWEIKTKACVCDEYSLYVRKEKL